MIIPAVGPSGGLWRCLLVGLSGSCLACSNGIESDEPWDAVPPNVPIITAAAFGSEPDSFRIDSVPFWTASVDPAAFDWRRGLVGVVALSDGAVAISNADQIHIVAANGRTRAVVGGAGDGPGEFRNLTGTCRTSGDTLVTYDMSHRRVSIVDAISGVVLRSFPIEAGLTVTASSCLEDGTVLILGDRVHPGSQSRELEVLRYRIDGSLMGTLFHTQLQRERIREVGRPVIAAAATRWFYGDPYYSEIRTFDSVGTLLRVLRIDNPVAIRPAGAPPHAEGAEGGIAATPVPGRNERRQGFFSWMVVDATGRLWVREIVEPGEPIVTTAFDAAGNMLGRFRAPDWLGHNVYHGDPGLDSWLLMRITDVGEILLERYRLQGPGLE